MKKIIGLLLIVAFFVGGYAVADDEEYMTDSGEVREVEGGEVMTDSGEMEDVDDDGEYMTDSGEVRSISDDL